MRKPERAGTAEHPGPRDFYQAMGLNETQIDIIRTATKKRHYYLVSPEGRRLFDLGLGPIALSFAGISSKEQIAHLDRLAQREGEQWPFAWLDEQGVDYAALAVTGGRLSTRRFAVLPASQSCPLRRVAIPQPARAQWAVTCVNCSTTWTQLLQYAKEAQSLATQLQQYQTQLQQYANMVTNTVALPQEIWGTVQSRHHAGPGALERRLAAVG